MLAYTKATLKAAIENWNVNSDPDFVTTLDEIIQKGEVRLAKKLDLDNLDTVNDTTTAALSAQAFKPLNLINERLVLMSVAGKNTTILKRSRAWVERYNEDGTTGAPRFYSEWDEDSWEFAPVPDADYLVTVHGNYTFASIVDGDDNNQTWFSTRVPDLLYLACSIEANEYLKFWAKRDTNLGDFETQSAALIGIAKNLQRSDIEDITQGGVSLNAPGTQTGNG